ncbi:MAG: hypothetical protein KDK10_14505, partial [Maritimibacter sp.]|nr:hypothetical protein [Maritimibacter sp.]
MRHFRH